MIKEIKDWITSIIGNVLILSVGIVMGKELISNSKLEFLLVVFSVAIGNWLIEIKKN